MASSLWRRSKCYGYGQTKWSRRTNFNSDKTVSVSHNANTQKKVMHPTILPSAVGKLLGQTGFINLDMETGQGEGQH